MQPDHKERIAEIVELALECDPAARDTLLNEACKDDTYLRAEVESLLQHQGRANQFLERPAYADATCFPLQPSGRLAPGQLLDQYAIVRLIGEGGMGEVYLAEATTLGRQVAIKLVKGGFEKTTFLRHFRNEERILAGLNHPNIAHLYGGGVTADGTPYYVMEYVEGERIDEYCRKHALRLEECLQLFCRVCAAVAYAHQHLVIHRDLKPANIPVTLEGEPKLLDFGIAKLLDTDTGLTNEHTVTLQPLLTPDYASPEQVLGEVMSTASDVYSLGIILYELLTGERPYRIKTRRPDEIARTITQREPTRPSTAMTGGNGKPRAELWNPKLLRGDLDNIVLRALRKEADRRYLSAAQLSQDIQRHLEGRPVAACGDTIGYRAGKFIRRNKLAVAAAGLVLVSLTAGMIATTYEARRAQRRFDEVRQLANSLMFEIHDAVQDLQGSIPARRLIVERALQYLDRLNREGGSDPSLQRELATAYEKVGDIQGNPYNPNLGDTAGALESYHKATALRERLSRRDHSVEAGIERARSYRGVGDIMLQNGDISQCLANYRLSLAILQQVDRTRPNDRVVEDELARAYDALGDGLSRSKDDAERLRVYQEALRIRSALAATAPDDARQQRSLAVALMKVAGSPGIPTKEAVTKVKDAVSIYEALAAADPQNARKRRELGFGYFELGRILTDARDDAAALVARQKALKIREAIAVADPQNQQAAFDRAAAHGDLAETYTNLHQSTEALPHAERAAELMGELVESSPTNAIYRRNLGLAEERVAAALELAAHDQKQPRDAQRETLMEAKTHYQKARDVFVALDNRHELMPNDSNQTAKFANKMAEMDTAIAKLQP